MGRKHHASLSLPMEQYSGDADSGLLNMTNLPDPTMVRIMAEDRRRKAKRRRQIIIGIAIIVGVVILLLGIAGGLTYFLLRSPEHAMKAKPVSDAEDPVLINEELRRVNCYPEQDGSPFESWHVSRTNCEKRGCIYRRPRSNPNMPVCYIPPSVIGYRKVDVRNREAPQRTTEYILRRLNPTGIFGTLVDGLNLAITELSETILRVHVTPENAETTPGDAPFDLANEQLLNTGSDFFRHDPDLKPEYKVEVPSDNPFSFRVLRATPGQKDSNVHQNSPVLWNTDIGGLIFTEDFIQVAGLVPRDSRVYGIGEHRHETFRRNHKLMAQTWSLFSRNQPPDWMTETHLYGAHPFVMVVDPNGLTHGILFYNAAPSEITVNPYPSISWRSVAGVIDMYIFVGPTPDNVIQQYTQLVGRPTLPPRWFLDLQVCFSGVETIADLERLYVEFNAHDLPWSTICLRQGNQFRYDTSGAFDDILAKWRQSTYNSHQRRLSYSLLPFVSTQSRGFSVSSDVLLGRVVENAVKKISCTNPGDRNKQTFHFTKKLEPSGILQEFGFWDPLAKEITNFLSKYLTSKWKATDFGVIELPESQPYINIRDKNLTISQCVTYELPYTTRAGYFQYSSSSTLGRSTACALALHRECTIPHVDVHNAYGLLLTKTVSEAWLRMLGQANHALNRRSTAAPVMSSSTFPGQGRYGGHWLGQTAATWMSMTASIMSMLEFNWFGVPLVGDWICGEEGPGNAELCSLWANLAAFQPVIRYDYSPQHRPAFYGLLNDSQYFYALNRSLTFRKHLMPYLFTQLYEFSQNGVPAWKPLFHLSPSDNSLVNEYHTFMLGDNLLVAPVLTPTAIEGRSRVQLVSHFRWLHLKTNREYDMCKGAENHARIFRTVRSLNSEGPENYVYLKGGSIVPVDTEALSMFNLTIPPNTRGRKLTMTTQNARHVSLLISEDCDHRRTKGRPVSRGSFYWEGGVNETSSVYVSLTLSQYNVLEGRMTFHPPRVLHSHLPPHVPRPPSMPWPFEVVIDHILYLGMDASRLLEQKTSSSSSGKSAPSSNEVKVDIKQASSGDATISTTRETIAVHYADKKILFAARVSIPISEGDFSIVLVPRSKQ